MIACNDLFAVFFPKFVHPVSCVIFVNSRHRFPIRRAELLPRTVFQTLHHNVLHVDSWHFPHPPTFHRQPSILIVLPEEKHPFRDFNIRSGHHGWIVLARLEVERFLGQVHRSGSFPMLSNELHCQCADFRAKDTAFYVVRYMQCYLEMTSFSKRIHDLVLNRLISMSWYSLQYGEWSAVIMNARTCPGTVITPFSINPR